MFYKEPRLCSGYPANGSSAMVLRFRLGTSWTQNSRQQRNGWLLSSISCGHGTARLTAQAVLMQIYRRSGYKAFRDAHAARGIDFAAAVSACCHSAHVF